MKENQKTVILVIILALVIAAAVVMYPKLSGMYSANSEIAPQESEGSREYAPDFEVLDADGSTVKLSDMRGSPVVVNFWATWCGYCVREFPAFESLCSQYPDIKFMMVDLTDGSRETVDIASDFILQNGYTFPVYFDTALSASSAYNVQGIPHTVFIDSEGYLFDSHVGAMDEEMLAGYLQQLTAARN